MRSLVVEDSVSMRELLQMELEDRGHDVTAAATAEEALDAHLSRAFDLMVIDSVLPGLPGIELARKVRALPRGDEPVIVLLTGRDSDAEIAAAIAAGIDDAFLKPLEPRILRMRILLAETAVRDVIRRRETEEALRTSGETFRLLIETAPDAIAVHRDGLFVYVNPALVRLLACDDVTDLIGTPIMEVVHAEDRERIGRRMQERDAGEPVAPLVQQRLVARDGSVAHVEVANMAITYEGRPARLLFLRDITERTHIQARALLTDRMATVGTLATGVAHELNNPLAFVLANLKLMSEELAHAGEAPSPEALATLRELIDEAALGAVRMSDIVTDLRTFSAADSSPGRLVDPLPIVEATLRLAANEIRHRAQLVTDLTSVPKVAANESRLAQAFLNFIMNAVQSLPEGRADHNEIRVRAYTDERGWAVFEFTDTGSGISAGTLTRIFDPFFTTRPPGEGSGLGLTICHNIVTGAGGDVEVDTEVGRGTTFRVKLPPAPDDGAAAAPRVRAEEPVSTRAARVLLVDDEALVSKSLGRVLKEHDVTIVDNGRDAIELMTTGEPFDVVFCDLMMPDVTGIDVYEQVKHVRPGAEDTIVFMTGGAFTTRAQSFLESVANVRVKKPFDLAEIRRIVRERAAKAGET